MGIWLGAASGDRGACVQTYGLLPCTNSAVGNLFLVLVHGYLTVIGGNILYGGGELLLEVLGPGSGGRLVLRILRSIPVAVLILVSGLSGSKETAQQQILTGMGLLAGSTIVLLTVLWGSCVVIGKCDLSENLTSIDSKDTTKFSLFGSGISTDIQTSFAARIMVISVIPLIILQLPSVFKVSYEHRLTVFISFILAVGFLLSYCLYQVFQPWIQKRRLPVTFGILRHDEQTHGYQLLSDDGSPNVPAIERLFNMLDGDKNGELSHSELKALVVGLQFEKKGLGDDDVVEKVMNDFDTSGNGEIDLEEFKEGIFKWLCEARSSVLGSASHPNFFDLSHKKMREEHDILMDNNFEEDEHDANNSTLHTFKAALFLLLGTIIAVIFANPLVDAVHGFSNATKIPSFFISFIAMPLVTNSSEVVSDITFASRKKQRTASLAFSEIYESVTMNNTLCLAVFLALVYFRNFTWNFSAEVLLVLIVCMVVGLFSSIRTTLPLWMSLPAFFLYPSSLLLVYILDFVFGWT